MSRKRDGFVSLAARGAITENDLSTRLAELDNRAQALENELEEYRQEGERLLAWQEERHQLQVWLGGLQPMLLDIVDLGKLPELQRELLIRTVDKIWVDRTGRIEIEGAINLPAPPKRPIHLKRPLERQSGVTSCHGKGLHGTR